MGVVFLERVLGEQRMEALVGPNPDLRVIGGAVALIGVLLFFVGTLEGRGLRRAK
jgi:hypothetical protein